jgi:murein DD-endopeptidase MepM/ murein hydrolase activator NlpD
LAGHVTAKLKRSLKAIAVVLLVGAIAVLLARPFVPFPPFGGGEGPLEARPPLYLDLEAEGDAQPQPDTADSEIEDIARRPFESVLTLGSGDTMPELIGRAGIAAGEAAAAAEALYRLIDPRTLKAGQKVTVTFAPSPYGFGRGPFRQVSLAPDAMRDIVARRGDRGFEAVETKRQLSRQIAHFQGGIKFSLYESATDLGVPVPVVLEMIKALSYDVDFQRDLQPGDRFDVLFEAWYDTKGKLVRAGDLIRVGLDLSGTALGLYRYEGTEGRGEYFTATGESVRKALLKTPVDGARITSGFGMRNHPILGYSKMHKGVDFGVPPGTPIQAAGDGTVEMAGPFGAYGNYVRLRHGNGYGTAYAHMSRIAPGIHTGRHVGQGQIIGYVGATGRATGPHLHYEVLVGNTQINPMSIKVPTGIKLAGRELDRYLAHRRQIDQMMAAIPSGTHVGAGNARLGRLGG